MDSSKIFNCVSYNCLGYKSSSMYVDMLCRNHDICFLCEHWLRPHEVPTLKSTFRDQGYWSVFKSSMDPEVVQIGRSYGGVGFVCRESEGITYISREVNSDRICAIQVKSGNSTVLNIFGVYLPCHNGTSKQIELYAETLELLQDAIDTCESNTPIMILGDFNASLPQGDSLPTNWYKLKPFSRQSLLLFDFLCFNSFMVCNFVFSQNVNYTYFKGSHKSYIDHCIVSSHVKDQVLDCKILNDCVDSTSDHFAIETLIKLAICSSKGHVKDYGYELTQHMYPYVNWKNQTVKEDYIAQIAILSKSIIPPVDIADVASTGDIQMYINEYCNNIVDVMHRAAKNASENFKVKQSKQKAKHWWNADCTNARDRHRFWFGIWKSCGRPREGAVFNSYKHSKHCYRKICRNRVKESINFNFNDCNELFKQKRMGKFWNKIKKARGAKHNTKNAICLEQLEEHFSNKFSYNINNENEIVSKAREKVNEKLKNCSTYDNDFFFTIQQLRKLLCH